MRIANANASATASPTSTDASYASAWFSTARNSRSRRQKRSTRSTSTRFVASDMESTKSMIVGSGTSCESATATTSSFSRSLTKSPMCFPPTWLHMRFMKNCASMLIFSFCDVRRTHTNERSSVCSTEKHFRSSSCSKDCSLTRTPTCLSLHFYKNASRCSESSSTFSMSQAAASSAIHLTVFMFRREMEKSLRRASACNEKCPSRCVCLISQSIRSSLSAQKRNRASMSSPSSKA